MNVEHLHLDVSVLCATFIGMGRFIDRRGHTYGNLTVLYRTRQNKLNQWFWICRCFCGKEKEIFSGNLKSGHTTSCGCMKGFKTHGESGNDGVGRSPEYQTLAGIISRCTNPNSPAYRYYGGRGIRVCERWNSMSKIENFIADVGRRPSEKHSIDRWPDKNGNYEPGNVRWATASEQTRNTRRNVWITFRGESLCRKDMAEKYGLNQQTLKARLDDGWSIHDALTTPINSKMRNKFAK